MPTPAETPLSAVEVQLRDWVAAIVERDGVALGKLFDHCAARLLSVAERVLRCEADAEEAVADVFSQVWRDAGKYDPARGSVEAWLLRLTHSRSIDRLRRRRARPDEGGGAHLDVVIATYTD